MILNLMMVRYQRLHLVNSQLSDKQYLSDNFNNSIEMVKLLNDEKITKSLKVENYKEDGKYILL